MERSAEWALEPFQYGDDGENPYQIQHDLQEMMQNLVGIVRTQQEIEQALAALEALEQRARRAGVDGNREYNPGWHTALDLHNLLTVSAAIAQAALERKESRGAHFREDFPGKDEALGKINVVIQKGAHGEMQVTRQVRPPLTAELKQIIEEMG